MWFVNEGTADLRFHDRGKNKEKYGKIKAD